jgi:D-alanine-D-alanine ligase
MISMEVQSGRRAFHRVAVLKGGPSSEREVSLASGAAVATGLRTAGYTVAEIDVTTREVDVPPGTEAVFIALHGAFGEDGALQELLRDKGIPYTGSGPESSRLSFDKRLSKKVFREQGVPSPPFEILRIGQGRSLSLPVVTKPPLQGSSIGIRRVFREEEWPPAMEEAARFDAEVLVEQFIEGSELTVGIVCGEVLPIIEIRAPGGYYDYGAKYTRGRTEYLVPAPIPEATARQCQDYAMQVYRAMDCAGMARVDIRLRPDGQPYVLELNSIPGFTETSLLPKAARAAGIEFPALCDRIMQSAAVK